MNVCRKHFTKSDGVLVAEASQLGMKPGQWPTAVILDGDGRHGRYNHAGPLRYNGEVCGHKYKNYVGAMIHIFND